MKNQIIKLMLAITIAFTAFSCTNDDNNKEIAKLPTITETLSADASFSVLVKSLRITGITNFSSAGSYTLFAPTNTAFAAYTSALFPTGINDATVVEPTTLSVAQIAELKKILQNHILAVGTKSYDLIASVTVSGYVKTFAPGQGTTTLSMFVNKPTSDVLVNGGATNGGAKITTADIDASNGIVHIVDAVIKLPKLVNHIIANPDLSTLYSVVSSTSTGTYGDQSAVLATLNGAGPLTLFAPLNDAFNTATVAGGFLTGTNATPTNVSKILRYHLSNGNLTSSSATSWTSSSATTDVTITTLAATAQTFKITLGTLKIKEFPAIAVPASNIKFVNIQATNGNIHTIDRVLQPILP